MRWLKSYLLKTRRRLIEKLKAPLIVVGIVLVPFIIWKVPEWQVRGYHGRLDAGAISKLSPQELIQLQQNLITAENNARVTIAQIIGGVVVLLGLYATFKNVWVAEEGKLTERFSKAVELLGSDKLDVRLGGIYALERIARDSQKDHWTVMEVLTAFVREQSKEEYLKSQHSDRQPSFYDVDPELRELYRLTNRLREDIQAALTAIGRRKWTEEERLRQRIDLSYSFLKGADLRRAKLERAKLEHTNLEGADLSDARLNYADLTKTKLNSARLHNTDLSRADFTLTELKKAELYKSKLVFSTLLNTDLTEAILYGAKFTNTGFLGTTLTNAAFNCTDQPSEIADLRGAVFRETKGLTWEQISESKIDEATMLPTELEERRKAEQEKKAAAQNQ